MRRLTAVLLLCILSLSFFSCGKDTDGINESLVGTWIYYYWGEDMSVIRQELTFYDDGTYLIENYFDDTDILDSMHAGTYYTECYFVYLVEGERTEKYFYEVHGDEATFKYYGSMKKLRFNRRK